MARPSTRSTPLLSAALIVKDEEAVIDRCLASLVGVVDEIVVLDTGSTDRTVEIARSRGARVVHGEWHDDFGRSRNECLGHCTGRWAVVVDADEVVRVANVGQLRRTLRSSTLDAYQIAVDSYSDDAGTVGVTHQSVRILNRRKVHYEGRLHEQVRANKSGKPLKLDVMPLVSMGHWGYIQRVVDERGKTERNIRICERAIADGAGPRGVVDLGRTLAAAGRHAEALEKFDQARAAEDGFTRRNALRQGVGALLKLDRPEEAAEWVADLREAAHHQGSVDLLEAKVMVARDRLEDAVRLWERNLRHRVVPDDDGVCTTATKVRTDLGLALLDGGRHRDGIEHLLAVATDGPTSVWPRLVAALHEMGQIDRAVAALDLPGNPDRARLVLAELAANPVGGVAELVEALHTAHPELPTPVAFAPLVAEQLTVDQAIAWAERARALGLSAHCPLHKRATADGLGPTDRLVAAGLLMERFGEARGKEIVEQIAGSLPTGRFYEALHLLDERAPLALEPFVVAAAHNTARCLAMAEALDAHGERTVAVNVLRFGIDAGADGAEGFEESERLLATWAD